MLAYAANRPVAAARGSAPNAMLAIIALHVAAVAALMSAKMDLPDKIRNSPIIIDLIKAPRLPPDRPIENRQPQPRNSTISRPSPDVPLPPTGSEIVDSTPSLPSFDELVGPSLDPTPRADPLPMPAPVQRAARLLTPAPDLRPPYPQSKLMSGEEAVLRLALTIDARGRVIAVEPVGRADRTFLEAARRHLLARWRYRPATADGRAVGSSITVTLRFQLEA